MRAEWATGVRHQFTGVSAQVRGTIVEQKNVCGLFPSSLGLKRLFFSLTKPSVSILSFTMFS